MISQENKEKVKNMLKSCDKTGLVFTCRMIETEYGLNFCSNRLIELMLQYPTWSVDQLLGQLEAELIEQNYY